MNKNYPLFSIVVVIVLFAIAFGTLVVQAEHLERPASLVPNYHRMVGQSLADKAVADFIAANHCTSANQYQLCEATGIALAMNGDRTIKTLVLFPGRTNGFAAFRGELPLNLRWNDSLASVNRKLGVSPDETFLQEAGLPNESGIPENIRLWAVYEEAGVTVIYNTLSADSQSASIHAILITK